jgi:hypothetical protein
MCPVMGEWELEYTPISFLGLAHAPAKIISITDDGLEEEESSQVDFINLSDKTIEAVKIKWFLYRVKKLNGAITLDEKPKIVMQRETSSLDTGQVIPGGKVYVRYPMGPCQEIYDALMKGDEKEGEPWIETSISEITYADGSKWTPNINVK